MSEFVMGLFCTSLKKKITIYPKEAYIYLKYIEINLRHRELKK